jgi:hypothetical protein
MRIIPSGKGHSGKRKKEKRPIKRTLAVVKWRTNYKGKIL